MSRHFKRHLFSGQLPMCSVLEKPFVGAYWGPRKIPKQDCADKVAKTLLTLAKWPPLGQWYFCMNEATAPIIPITVTVKEIMNALEVNRSDFGGNFMEDLGFSFFAWSGNVENACGISFRCGAWFDKITNCAVLKLRPQNPPANASEGENLREMMEVFIKIWDPDRAVVTSHQFRDRNRVRDPDGGWFVYHKGQEIQCLLP